MDLYVAHILILMLNFWKNKSLTCNFFLHFTDFLRKVYGILSVQLLFTFLTASVFKWSSVITYIVQTKLVID